jgi:hypothetical protein
VTSFTRFSRFQLQRNKKMNVVSYSFFQAQTIRSANADLIVMENYILFLDQHEVAGEIGLDFKESISRSIAAQANPLGAIPIRRRGDNLTEVLLCQTIGGEAFMPW